MSPSSPTLDRLLRRLQRYGPPDEAERKALLAILSPVRTVPAHQEIIRQFSKPEASTVLLSGLTGRVVTLKGGAQQITALEVPGDFVDLHSFLLARMDHSVVTLTECQVTTAPHGALKGLTDRFPRLARALWYLTLVDSSIHRHWLTVIGRRGAVSRAAHLLCELNVRLQDVGLAEDGAFVLGLTQAEVGDVLSLSTVHVNRVVQDLRARGLVAWDRRKVRILDWMGLCQLAEFEPTYLHLEDQVETN
jgi:CRP-like cAMP-binding protein